MRPSTRTAGIAGPRVRCRCRLSPAAALLGGLLAVSPTCADGVYKWVDQQGKVHYGDRPPTAAAATEMELKDRPAPAADNARRREKTRRLLDAIENDRKQKKAVAAQEQARSAQRERNCSFARRRAEILQRANSVSVTDDDDKRRYLNDQERAAALARARKLVQEWC